MEDTSFIDQLDRSLCAKIERMDRVELKQLKDDYRLFQSAFQAIYNVLLRKGIIHEDPYKYELKISEVTTPSEHPFAENEKLDQMCIRLSQFESYLDFLNNYYQFSTDFLTIGRIKRLVALTKYFNFIHFTENSPHMNTRYLAEMLTTIRKGSDPLSSGILNEALLQMDKATKKIFHTLKDLTLIHKERFKLEIRRLVLQRMDVDRDFAITHREDLVHRMRQKWAESTGDLPFYAELAEEIILEDFSSEGQSARDEILRRLAVQEEKKNLSETRSFKAVAMEGSRVLIAAGFQLGDAVQKLQDNQALLDVQDRTFMTKVKRALRQMMGKKAEHVIHDVEYFDPVTSERKNESIDLTALLEDAGRRAQSLSGMVSRTSVAAKRLENATEEQVYKFLEKGIEDLQSYYRKFFALDDFFKTAVTDPDLKGRVRSVMMELGSIKNAFIKANQKRHEYIAQREELEQMKRLGIREA